MYQQGFVSGRHVGVSISSPHFRDSEKIPQPGNFNDMFGRQNSGGQFTLRSGVYLIQMMLRCGFGHELPDAFVKSAISDKVGTGAPRVADAFILE